MSRCALREARHLNVGGLSSQRIKGSYIVDDHVDVLTEDGELVGEAITLNPEKDYQPINRGPRI